MITHKQVQLNKLLLIMMMYEQYLLNHISPYIEGISTKMFLRAWRTTYLKDDYLNEHRVLGMDE